MIAGAGYYGRIAPWAGAGQEDGPLTATAHRATLRIVVTERGNLESTVTIDGICDLMGYQNKIIELVAEGTRVEKGQVVCRFDSSEIDKNIAQQQIKARQAQSKIQTATQQLEIDRNKAEADIIAAEVELQVAELTLKMFAEGTNPADVAEAQSKIHLARKEYEKTKDEYDQMEQLVRKGFRSPAQLRSLESQLEQYKYQKESEERRLTVKKQYEFEKTTVENRAKVEQARKKVGQMEATLRATIAKDESEVEAAVATHAIEDQQLQEYLAQKEKTVIPAEGAGIVAYANEPYYDSSRQIREGATVYSRQKIFSIPDLSHMQVKVNVHESLVKKIQPGQKAEVRIDAFPTLVLVGTVQTVSNLADSNRGWLSGGVKEYTTVVTLDATPADAGLKPGMTAEVKIRVAELAEALVVPIQAVAEHQGAFYAFVAGPDGFAARRVDPGETDETYVQIRSGLEEGDRVALDARTRAAALFKEEKGKRDGSKPDAAAGGSPGASPTS